MADPYDVLDIDKNATANQIKSAYRKAALKYHPDKATTDKDEANKKFQEIAFAYAILSDERRRKRYDATGNTADSLNIDDDDFDWVDYFREQTRAMVDGQLIDEIKREYQGSTEEREDVLRVYTESQGDLDAVYEEIMCSNVLDDDKRFRGYIDLAIKDKQVESYKKYTKETKTQRKQRENNARGEAVEAMELAKQLGTGSDDLKSLIQQRQQDRSTSFMDHLEAKYGGKKRKVDEPPEELFLKNTKKTKKT